MDRLPFPNSVLRTLPGQETFIEQLKTAVPEDGAYMIPGNMEAMEADETFEQRHNDGPIAMLMYYTAGAPIMDMNVMIYGFLHMFVAAFIAGIVVAASEANSFFSRAMLIFWVGVFCAVWAEVTNVIWWYFPVDYCILKMVYHITCCLIMGIVLGAIMRPARVGVEG